MPAIAPLPVGTAPSDAPAHAPITVLALGVGLRHARSQPPNDIERGAGTLLDAAALNLGIRDDLNLVPLQ